MGIEIKELLLNDFIKVAVDSAFTELEKAERIKIVDSEFEMADAGKVKGLRIKFDLSNSCKVINDRVYSYEGQREGAKSATRPYKKPILLHHDKKKDNIGRFTNCEWVDLSTEAMAFFDSRADFMRFKKTAIEGDPEKLYKAMKDHGLLTNPEWPGLSKLTGEAFVSDKEAITKFLDKRYLTFSAGAGTDKHVCSLCLQDWAKEGRCGHRHGEIIDGDMCVFYTGAYKIKEASVVNMPANDSAVLLSMELLSDQLSDTVLVDSVKVDPVKINFTDSIMTFDEEIEMPDEIKNQIDVEALTKQIQDSLIGQLTNFMKDEFTKIRDEMKETSGDDGDDNTDTSTQDNDLKVDWKLLDKALKAELGSEALSDEEVSILDESTFCGPERSFPIANQTYLEKAKALISDTIMSDEDKEKLLKIVDSKGQSAINDFDAKIKELQDSLTSKIQEIKDELNKLTENSNTETDTGDDENNNGTDGNDGNDGNDGDDTNLLDTQIDNPGESSSDSSTGGSDQSSTKQLGKFEQRRLDKYKKILDSEGEIKAESYWQSVRGYFSRGFNPKEYLS